MESALATLLAITSLLVAFDVAAVLLGADSREQLSDDRRR